MKRTFYILLIVLALYSGCTKDEPTRTSGTDTIDNITYFSTSYYNYGFSFSKAQLVSTINSQEYDISIYVNKDNLTPRLTLETHTLYPSFSKVGDYTDEASAISAFNNLKTVSGSSWVDNADPVNANQVWIYKSREEKYTKIRIVKTVNEKRQGIDYGECTFQWVSQPDGSLTFP